MLEFYPFFILLYHSAVIPINSAIYLPGTWTAIGAGGAGNGASAMTASASIPVADASIQVPLYSNRTMPRPIQTQRAASLIW